jgi:hypothetical protein
MQQPPPSATIFTLANAFTVARCLHVVADAGVADVLDDQPATAAELAAATGLNADAVNRMLRLLAAEGVFAHEAGGYIHTPASRLLRTDHPQSMRSVTRMVGLPVFWNNVTELRRAAATGRPALDWAGIVAHLSTHPEESSLFNQAMVDKSRGAIPAVVDTYDFTPFGAIADIGGGHGHLVRAILERCPSTAGVLFDLPHVIDDAARTASSRLRLQAGDFFRDPLPPADAYVAMEVLHDWNDDDAARILTSIRRAAPAHARLLIVEQLIPDVPGPHAAKLMDVIMLAITGGRERTPAEYATLLDAAGFRLARAIPTPSPFSIVEAVVA